MGFIIGLLKVIGFILLFLVLLILFLASVILFVPIRYQLSGNGRPYELSGNIHWLFGLLKFGFSYSNGSFQTTVWYPFKKKKRKNKRNKTASKEPTIKESEQSFSEHWDVANAHKECSNKIEQKATNKSKKIPKKKKLVKREKKHFDFVSKIKNLKEILSNEENKELIHYLLKQLKFLMKHVKPSQIKASISFSTTDPALTGEILGGLSIFPFLYQKNVSIMPDFTSESTYVEGYITCKGHLFGIHMLILGIRLLANKKIRSILFNRR